MVKFFGTDGIRGITNGSVMNPFFIMKIALAIYRILLQRGKVKNKTIVIAKDTRRSGYMIENALASSLMSFGINIILVGPIPTPAIPFLVKLKKAQLGLMISASHNSYYDNGIKIFDSKGNKIPEKLEIEMEKIIENDDEFKYDNLSKVFVMPEEIATLERIHNTDEQYVEFLLKRLKKDNKNLDLSSMKIVIDCANGAGYKTAKLLFGKLNANLVIINNRPNGLNINEKCGAMDTESLSKAVKKYKADLGIALDGDADRVVLCDENGDIIDNDKLMIMIAIYYKKRKLLKKSTLVTTILSNNHIEMFLKSHGISVHRTPVGDRYISEAFNKKGFNFGGEKSGHIIFADYSTSGDGALSGLIATWILKQSNQKASQFFKPIELLPQITRNLSYEKNDLNPDLILENPDLKNQLTIWEKILGEGGRILVRKSGTEKKIRLMAEGADLITVNLILDNVSSFLNNFLL